MKGTVVNIWINTLKRLYGEDKCNAILIAEGWQPERVITPLEEIDDAKIKSFMNRFAKSEGLSEQQIWRKLGQNNIKSFYNWFPSFFDKSTAMSFMMMMDNIHTHMTKMMAGAKPPRMTPQPIDEKSFLMIYQSKRGLQDYAMGLIEGVSEHFNEPIDVEIVDKSVAADGTHTVKMKLSFEKSPIQLKRFNFSKVLSLKFIKNPLVKAIWLPVVSSTLVAGIITQFDNLLLLLAVPTVTAVTAYLAAAAVQSPLMTINEQIDEMEQFNLSSQHRVDTDDRYEALFERVGEAKGKIQEQMTYFKGGMDDLYSFIDKFGGVAENLSKVSDKIAGSVQEVAAGAVHQASETEKSVSILSGNIELLNEISERENEGQVHLESAVSQIEVSFEDIENVANTFNGIKDNFSEVNAQGIALSQKVQDIISIVKTVEAISDQTGLLALNASIEAASAGEAGRGFSVVAEEVRKLADNSKQSVNTINASLEDFIKGVNSMVEQVSDQFDALDDGVNTMNSVTNKSREATQSVAKVSRNIAEMSHQLSIETTKISGVFENMNTLAAIAEENSATSEEMSANVTQFSSQIIDLMENIHELEKVVLFNKKELEKFKL